MATSIDLKDELAKKIKKLSLELGKSEVVVIEGAIKQYEVMSKTSNKIKINNSEIDKILEEASRVVDEKYPERKKRKEVLSKHGPDIEELQIEIDV